MNVVVLLGNLAGEPELRQTANGKAVCSFRLAVSRPGGEGADFFTVVTWERQAEVCAEYLAKGRRVAVEGRLHHSTWEVEDGKRSKVEVVAHRVKLLGAPRSDGGAFPGPSAAPVQAAADDAAVVAAEEREPALV